MSTPGDDALNTFLSKLIAGIANDDPLYKSDERIAEKIGIGRDRFSEVAKVWEVTGFPKHDPVVKKRYWPACRAWLDRRNGVGAHSQGRHLAPDGEENFHADRRPRSSHAQAQGR